MSRGGVGSEQRQQQQQQQQQQQRQHVCSECGHTFSTRQAKSVHRKRHCNGVPTNPAKLEAVERQLEALRAEMAAFKLQQQQQQRTTTQHNTIIGSNNTVNNTTTINTTTTTTIKMNCFRREDLSFLAHEMVRDLVKQKDLHASLQEMIRLIHFNPEVPQNATVYLPDEKSPHGFCWGKDGTWQRRDALELAKLVMLGAASVMSEHNDEPFHTEYTRAETKRFDTFCEKLDDEPDRPIGETINTMANLSNLLSSMGEPELIPEYPPSTSQNIPQYIPEHPLGGVKGRSPCFDQSFASLRAPETPGCAAA